MQLKKYIPDVIAIVAFIVLSFAYFFPAAIENRALLQHDIAAGVGSGQEIKEYYEQTGERSRWTNALFGGMPTYQISPSYDSIEPLKVLENIYHLYLPSYVWLTFIMMLGFYILLRAFGLSAWLSLLGGVIWGFSSYFFILIAAGHIWKFVTLAYIPPTIAGIVLAYRKKYLLGGLLTALFLAMQIQSNHVQMSYYFLFVILFMVIAYFIDALRHKELPHFFKASAILLAAAIIGVCMNLSNLYHTYEYSKQTMRGKSELVFEGAQNDNTSSGLDKDYITQWSYGIGETLTLLVPNVRGGASVPLAKNEKAMEKANPMYGSLYPQLTQYFGDQPMTSGPVYVGAFVVALFLLGCFLVKGPMKWALLGATVFSILLSWGHNFMPLTDFFIDYVPMYNKFRAVSSILVIAEFTMPLLAVLALKEIFTRPEILKENRNGVIISFALTGGVALLLALAPGILIPSFIPAQELNALQQGIPNDQLMPVLDNISAMRRNMVTADAWKSFFLIVCGFALIALYMRGKLKSGYTIAAIIVLCLVEMWSVNKNYLNDEMFKPQKSQLSQAFGKSRTDELILQDEGKDYRVLNFASNTFNENNTSYYHKSIGGYHAAKLRRYQEMIEHHIAPQMQTLYREMVGSNGQTDSIDSSKFEVINMLNTKYFILPVDQKGNTAPILNPFAYGNAWFVDNVVYVANANEEIEEIGVVNPRNTAVVDKRFEKVLNSVTSCAQPMGESTIVLKSYTPNRLVYEVDAVKDGVVVFSEIYYPDWQATIDGQEASIAQADYILRAMYIPAGKHTIEMTFRPTSIKVTETIAYIAFSIFALGVITFIVLRIRQRKTNR